MLLQLEKAFIIKEKKKPPNDWDNCQQRYAEPRRESTNYTSKAHLT